MAQDFNNIPAGLNIPTQIPLNIKENVLNEATLAYLGLNNNLALTYHDQMIVTCLEEGTRYIWREVLVGEENTGLVPLDFTYPSNIIVYGIIYSNKKFNFFKLPSLEQKYTIANIGSGQGVYKNTTIVGDNTQFNLKKLNSSSLNITTSLDGNTITIDTLDSGIRRFIVNSDYTGLIEEGTVSRPFKNLQNSLNAYVGIGTNILPENSGVVIDVQKDTNVFVGNLAYQNLNLIVREGATIVSTPAFGNYLLDIDSDAILPTGMIPFSDTSSVQISIKTEETGLIYLNKEGFKNRGTTFNSGLSRGKQVSIQGEIAISPDISVALPSTRKIIDLNSDNQIGFYNDNNVVHFVIEKSVLQADTSKIFYCGAKGMLYVSNSTISIGNGVTPFNVNTIPFTFNDGKVVEQNNSTKVIGIIGNIYNIVYGYYNNSTHINNGSITSGTCNYIFANMDSTNTTLDIKKTIFDIVVITAINLSPFILWTNLFFKDNYFYLGAFNYSQSTIQPNATNSINGQIVETLNQYNNRASAIIAGLFSGCKFINTGGVVSPTTGWFVDIVI